MMEWGWIWLGVAGIVLFVVMGYDKRQAAAGQWRVPEKTLWLLALLGGALGGCLGMKVFRHKTRHLSFVLGFPMLAVVWIAALLWAASQAAS